MNICLINNLYPPYARGGAEQVVYKTVQGLAAAGHRVIVITSSPDGETVERDGNVTIYRYPPANLFFYTEARRFGSLARLSWHLIDMFHVPSAAYVQRILEREMPDIVHTHNIMGMSFLIPRMIRRLGLRHIHTVHDVQLVEPSGIILKKKASSRRYTGLATGLYSACMRRLIGSPEAVISPSQFLLDFYEARGFFPHSKRILLRNPVSTLPNIRRDGQRAGTHFLYLGQIEDHKGVLFLLRTFKTFLRERAPCAVQLHIAGTGSRAEDVRRLSGDEPRIVFHGKVERETLPRLFGGVHATIVPSLCYENSPTVIFESFSFGVPVLASRVEGIAELIQEHENGLTFETEDDGQLIEKMAWCVSHPEELARMGRVALQSLTGLSQQEYIGRLAALYEEKSVRS